MSEFTSTKPYMIRAMHEWCVDNGLTPHLLVAVDGQTRVPMAYVKDGEIVLNINYSATKNLQIGNDAITFSARFGGVANELYVPMHAVRGVFARENGQGLFFQPEPEESGAQVGEAETEEPALDADENKKIEPAEKKPFLKLVK
ncbi:MAG: ClpXP protease specificity-enhancing factor [Betaproteobacteria bacterium HGW-Betaproteobacteria-2]|nr:MAG: ClpXP protease specificity-enhancing factor [Betaproteobacteria bacterium HGW-Betaproteobacteria-2]